MNSQDEEKEMRKAAVNKQKEEEKKKKVRRQAVFVSNFGTCRLVDLTDWTGGPTFKEEEENKKKAAAGKKREEENRRREDEKKQKVSNIRYIRRIHGNYKAADQINNQSDCDSYLLRRGKGTRRRLQRTRKRKKKRPGRCVISAILGKHANESNQVPAHRSIDNLFE